jgi:hypothetical protein
MMTVSNLNLKLRVPIILVKGSLKRYQRNIFVVHRCLQLSNCLHELLTLKEIIFNASLFSCVPIPFKKHFVLPSVYLYLLSATYFSYHLPPFTPQPSILMPLPLYCGTPQEKTLPEFDLDNYPPLFSPKNSHVNCGAFCFYAPKY